MFNVSVAGINSQFHVIPIASELCLCSRKFVPQFHLTFMSIQWARVPEPMNPNRTIATEKLYDNMQSGNTP